MMMSFDVAIAESERLGEQPVAWESMRVRASLDVKILQKAGL